MKNYVAVSKKNQNNYISVSNYREILFSKRDSFFKASVLAFRVKPSECLMNVYAKSKMVVKKGI